MQQKRFIQQLLIFLLVLFSTLFLRQFISNGLIEIGYDSYQIQTLISIGANIILICFSYYLIQKNGLEKLAGLKGTKLRRWFLLLFPFFYLASLNVLLMDEQTGNATFINIVLYFIYFVSVGFTEELSVRGFMQSHFISYLGNSKKNILFSVIISALFFGFVHLIKFDKGIYGELSQVLFATFIGAMFGAVLLATRKLYPLVIIHAIVDMVANVDTLGVPFVEKISEPWTIENSVIIALLTLPCFIYAIFILKKYPLHLELKKH